jgi:hypothetical protein
MITAMVVSFNPYVFAQSTSNQIGNNATSNSTANGSSSSSGGRGNPGKMHLDAAAKALQSGDKNGALIHINEVDKTLADGAKMYLDAAISALQSVDTNGAMMYLQESQKNL